MLRKDDAIQHVAFLRRELEELRPTRSNGSHFPTNSQIHVIGKLTKLLEISENLVRFSLISYFRGANAIRSAVNFGGSSSRDVEN